MKFTIATIAVFAAAALAMPAKHVERQFNACSGLYSNAQCCATNVLDLADLNCNNPPTTPTSAEDFQNICASIGQQAQCCAIPLLGQGVLCETPAGINEG